jgi:hypothetical protein
VGGIDLLGRCSPWKVPLAPLTIRPFRCLSLSPRHRNDRKGRPGDAPLRRTPTLAHMFRQATTKRHFEHSAMQFSAGCCLNDTSLETASGHARTRSEAAVMRSNTLKSHRNICWPSCGHTPHPDRRVSVNGYSNENGVNADWVEQHSQRAVFGDDSLRAQATSARTIPSRRPVVGESRHHARTRQCF